MKNGDKTISALCATGLRESLVYDVEPYPLGTIESCSELNATLVVRRATIELLSRNSGERERYLVDDLLSKIEGDPVDQPIDIIRKERIDAS